MGVLIRGWVSRLAAADPHWALKVVTPPAITEPITLTQAKERLKVDASDTSSDAVLTGLISSARQQVEADTGRILPSTTFDFTLDSVPADGVIVLPKGPLVSVTSINLYDIDDVATLLAAANYRVDVDSDPPRIILDIYADPAWWPNTEARSTAAVVARVVLGHASVPAWGTEAMYWKLLQWFGPNSDRDFARDRYDEIVEPQRIVGVA